MSGGGPGWFPDVRGGEVVMSDLDARNGFRIRRPRPEAPIKTLVPRLRRPVRVPGGGFEPPRGVTVPVFLAAENCRLCAGTGTRFTPRFVSICGCVFRGAARHVLSKLRQVEAFGAHHNAHVFTVRAEFLADVDLLGRRLFRGADLQIFRMFLCQRREWSEVARVVKLDRGNVFHAVYRIQQTFGYHVISTPLFPCARYFSGVWAAPEITVRKAQAVMKKRPFLEWHDGERERPRREAD